MKLKFLLRSGSGYMTQQLWRTTTFYGMPNVKRDGTRRNLDFKQQTRDIRKELKAKTFKKACLSTSLTNLYLTKLNLAIEIRNKN